MCNCFNAHLNISASNREAVEYVREKHWNLYYLCMPFFAAWLAWDGMCHPSCLAVRSCWEFNSTRLLPMGGGKAMPHVTSKTGIKK